jgi:Acyltransferase family.
MAIFLFFKDYTPTINFSEKLTKIIILISKYSFGIYLVHVFVLHLVKHFIPVNSFCPILSIPIITILVTIISFMCVSIIDKIPIVKKYAI